MISLDHIDRYADSRTTELIHAAQAMTMCGMNRPGDAVVQLDKAAAIWP